MRKFITLVISFTTLLWLGSCKHNYATISGVIEDCMDSTIYLEQLSLSGTVVLDSAIIDGKDRFKFKIPRTAYPDLYQLKLGNQRLVFAVDSTESIELKTTYNNFALNSEISGSEKSIAIQHLRQSVSKLQGQYINLNKVGSDYFLSSFKEHRTYSDSLIMSNPSSIVSYYAIYQKIGDYFIYSPYNKTDRIYVAAVATGFETYMPDYSRTKALTQWVLGAIQAERKERQSQSVQDMIDNAQMAELDIELENNHGEIRKLSDLRGKVVLLDFSAINMPQSSAYILELRELYNKYHQRGLEIYQVSLDTDINLWKKGVDNLPWICVRENRSQYSSSLITYNVHSIPTMFIINRKGDIMARHTNFTSIKKDIEKYL